MNDKIPVVARTSYYSDLITQCRLLKQRVGSEDTTIDKTLYANKGYYHRLAEDIRICLNNIFRTKICRKLLITENLGGIPFGIYVDPIIPVKDIPDIIYGDNEYLIQKYEVEIDSNIVNLLEPEQIAAYLVEEVYGITSPDIIPLVRTTLDLCIYTKDSDIHCDDLNNKKRRIILFGLKDVIQKLGSLTTKDEDLIGSNVYAKAFDFVEDIDDVMITLRANNFIYSMTEVPKTAKMILVMNVVKDYETASADFMFALEELKKMTNSVLYKEYIDWTLKFSSDLLKEAVSCDMEVIYESIPFFTKLKRNGLRQIEDDFYEFKVRVKNCELQEDAIYILRQVNSRIAILDDYVMNADISDYERNKYMDLIYKFRDLREEIGKKTIKYKKQYGVFVDYDKLDALDMM